MRYLRLYSDATGESHFEDCELVLEERDYAPPADPLFVSEHFPASAFHLIEMPVGWVGDWHHAPRRQWLMVLGGGAVIRASDGTERTLGVGDLFLVEDTVGRGHYDWNTSDTPLVLAVAICDSAAEPRPSLPS
jgi:oxalate decarboxylase/phosphoglucose isomerase-like protein (cupin superfamily)